jgi:mRNA interferase HicA
VFENGKGKGSEFLRKGERGSGSHGTLYVGNRFTVVKDLKKEIGAGLLSDMLKQLGIRKEDL